MSVVCKNLSVINKNKTLYEDISFEIPDGCFAVIYDPGSDTDLLYALSGIERTYDGSVYINSQDINELYEKELTRFRRENISVIFHENNLISGFNILENIMITLEFGNIKTENSKIDFIVNLFGLNGKMYLAPSQLSYYEQLRVSLARAAITGAGTVFLYNAEKHLSEEEKNKLNGLLLMCRERFNQTIVYLCGDEKIKYDCDREYIIKNGRLS